MLFLHVLCDTPKQLLDCFAHVLLAARDTVWLYSCGNFAASIYIHARVHICTRLSNTVGRL